MYLAVPLRGVDDRIAALVGALRANGIGREMSAAASVRRVRHSPPRLLADDAPVTVYSRPADTQLMSWNRFPDTAFAAVSSAPS